MGILNKLLETKYCSICNQQIPFATNKKLRDGSCCASCYEKLSPFYRDAKRKYDTVADIKYQIERRKASEILSKNFQTTRHFGADIGLFVDEEKRLFYVASNDRKSKKAPDIIECSSITRVSLDLDEHRTEMKYRDSNDEVKSFNPPCYACSYDFYIDIDVNIPYIESIRIKLNKKPVDNNQAKIVKLNNGGLIGKFTDAFLPAKSYNGKTSNADEVIASDKYQYYSQVAEEIKETLLSCRKNTEKENTEICKCPWCGMNVFVKLINCNHCGGPLNNP